MMSVAEISERSIVCWSADAVATEVNDEIVLMNLERDRCYGLGSTGSDLWRRLGKPVQVSRLLEQMREEYDAPAGALEADVLRTLRQLAEEGLIEVVSGGC